MKKTNPSPEQIASLKAFAAAKPLMVELFAGLHGWGEGAIAEGFRVIGFDLVDMCAELGVKRPKGIDLVIQDVLTLHGSQFRNAAVIVASPPCQEYSYMAMPWSRAKQIAGALREEVDFPEKYTGSRTVAELRTLFDACFRIAKEAGVPLVVENVKGAQPWVGKARAHFGSFYLWGDVGMVGNAIVGPSPKFGEVLRAKKRGGKASPDGTEHPQGSWFKIADSKDRGSKNDGGSWFPVAHNTESGHGQNPDGREGTKQRGSGAEWFDGPLNERRLAKNTAAAHRAEMLPMLHLGKTTNSSRKAASAQIAKIPAPLAQHIARVFRP